MIAQSSTTEREIPTLSPQINAAPSLTPTILDPTAPDPQACPGYKASNVVNGTKGFTADLTIAGANCQAYGNDIADLTLEVSYQAKSRLNVRIYPKYLGAQNTTQYLIPADIVPQPSPDGETTDSTSDLAFEWSNDPSFQFQVSRRSTGESLFSSYGHVIVFEDQFIEVVTNMVDVSCCLDICDMVGTSLELIRAFDLLGLQPLRARGKYPRLPPRNELHTDVLRNRQR